jgi:hypothetical protein
VLHPALFLILASDAAPLANPAFSQPQIVAAGKSIALTFGSANNVYFAASPDGGKTISAPVLVNANGKLSLGRHRGPRIAWTPKAIVISAITGEQGGGRDGDVNAWHSTDQGKTWSGPVKVNDVPGAAREGLHSMAASPDGSLLYAAWLDLRSKGTKLYGSSSKDGGKTWTPNEVVYQSPEEHICECCHPTVAFSASGTPLVMFRNWLAGSRDMYVVDTKTHTSTKMGQGTWPLNACPMDGGGLAIDGKRIFSAWRRDGAIFWNEMGQPEHELGKGKDPAIAAAPGQKPVVVWKAPDGLRTSGKVLDPDGAYPSLAVVGTSVFAAWESPKSGIRIEKLN